MFELDLILDDSGLQMIPYVAFNALAMHFYLPGKWWIVTHKIFLKNKCCPKCLSACPVLNRQCIYMCFFAIFSKAKPPCKHKNDAGEETIEFGIR